MGKRKLDSRYDFIRKKRTRYKIVLYLVRSEQKALSLLNKVISNDIYRFE